MTDTRFLAGIAVGVIGTWAVHRFVRPMRGKS